VEFTIHPVVDADGGLTGIAATVRDVTARFEQTRALKRELAAVTATVTPAAPSVVSDGDTEGGGEVRATGCADTTVPPDELAAFEVATRDLVGVALRSVEHLEVSLPQFRLLWVLRELGRCSSTECARALGVARSSVTRLADRLHASGHLVRGADPANRSVVTLELAPRGNELVQQVIDRRRHELGHALDHLDATARTACALLLHDLHERLGDGRPDTLHSLMPL
jgi:DNA-binding MarR family transcriptional regulator